MNEDANARIEAKDDKSTHIVDTLFLVSGCFSTILSMAASPLLLLRDNNITFAPITAKQRDVSSPNPTLAPVIITVLPFMEQLPVSSIFATSSHVVNAPKS
jgi:hypothetical protein